MRTVLASIALLLSTSAFAQEVDDQAWITEDTSSLRFVEGRVPGPDFEATTRVLVVAKEGELVRVVARDRMGWVSPEFLTTTSPNDGPEVIELTPVTP